MRQLAMALLLLTSSPALSGQEVVDPFTSWEPLVLTFRQGRTRLADGVLGFRSEDGKVFLPLEETSRAVGFALHVEVAKRRAEGFYMSEENRFLLDLNEGTVLSAGQSFEVEEGSVRVADFDLLVELTTLNKWLKNVDFKYHSSYLVVEVTSNPPLPKLQRFGRDHVRGALSAAPASSRQLAEVVADYQLFSFPVIDVDSSFGWSSSGGVSGAMGLRGVQDLAGMGASWYLALDRENPLREARITLSRKDPAGTLLGPLALTELEVGDVSQFGTPLISRGLRGTGIRLTNRPRDIASGTTLELRGELPEGWEAELYRGGILIGFETLSVKGEYVFADIALQAGLNELTVKRYGPQGQEDETSKTIRLGGDQPAPGTWYGEVSSLLQQQETISVESSSAEDVGDPPDLGELAAEARFELGLRPGLSVAASWSTMSLAGERRDFAGLSAKLSPWGLGLTLDGAFDRDGNWAAGGRMVGNIAGFGVFLQHQEFAPKFRSPVTGTDRHLQRHSQLRAHRRFKLGGFPAAVNTLFSAEYAHFADAGPRLEFGLGASLPIGEVQLNHRFTGSFSATAEHWGMSDLKGRWNLSTRRRSVALRGGLGYSIAPEPGLESVSLSGSSRFLDGKLGMRVTLDHKLGDSSSIGFGLGWNVLGSELSTQLSYNTTGRVAASASFRFGIGAHGPARQLRFSRPDLTSQGLAYAEVFVDDNHDGQRSPGEKPLAGVRFTPGSRSSETDEEGHVMLSGFTELLATEVVLDEGSLPDPFLRPTVPGYLVTVRPGAAAELSFAVSWMSDVEGKVLVTEETLGPTGVALGPRTRGLGNVQLVVQGGDGREVRRLRSEFDGFFSAASLLSGEYRIRIDADQAARFGLDDGGGIEVTLKDDTAILSGVVFHLTSSEPVEVAEKSGEQDR